MFRVGERARKACVTGVVCAAVGLAAMMFSSVARSQTATSAAGVAPAAPSAVAGSVGEQTTTRAHSTPEVPAWVEADDSKGWAFVYPPAKQSDAAQPVTVLLHGMCGHPQNACAPFADVSTSRGWLVCPQGEDECGGGASWRLNGPSDSQLIDASVRAVAQDHRGEVDTTSPRILVGFSLGGIAAMQIAQKAASGTYSGLVIIASQVQPNAALLKKEGIQRVVFAAGDYDMTSAPLQRDARILSQQGVPTRFVSLGKFGHGYPSDMQERMREPMQWVAGEPRA
jgi:predicted esterase